MGGETGQPLDQFGLTDVGLTHLPVQPQDQRLLRPTFNLDVQAQLLLFAGEPIGQSIPVQVDLEAVGGFTDGEFVLVQPGRVVQQ